MSRLPSWPYSRNMLPEVEVCLTASSPIVWSIPDGTVILIFIVKSHGVYQSGGVGRQMMFTRGRPVMELAESGCIFDKICAWFSGE